MTKSYAEEWLHTSVVRRKILAEKKAKEEAEAKARSPEQIWKNARGARRYQLIDEECKRLHELLDKEEPDENSRANLRTWWEPWTKVALKKMGFRLVRASHSTHYVNMGDSASPGWGDVDVYELVVEVAKNR